MQLLRKGPSEKGAGRSYAEITPLADGPSPPSGYATYVAYVMSPHTPTREDECDFVLSGWETSSQPYSPECPQKRIENPSSRVGCGALDIRGVLGWGERFEHRPFPVGQVGRIPSAVHAAERSRGLMPFWNGHLFHAPR